MRICHRTQRIRSLLSRRDSVGEVFNATGYDLVLILDTKADLDRKASIKRLKQKYVLKRQRAAGCKIPTLMRDYNLSEEEVRIALGQTPDYIAKMRRNKKAVDDLRSQGFSEEQIAAVFGK